MSKDTKLTQAQQKELAALAAMPDEDIDTSDIPERTDWAGVEIGKFYRPIKKSVTIRLDADVIAWFKAHNKKYQSAVNQALREYMIAHQD